MSTAQADPEERLDQATWQDGSIDLAAGIGATLIGLSWIIDLVWLGAIAPALMFPLWQAARARWIEPRIGQVRFSAPRRRKMQRGHLMLIGAGLVAFFLGLATLFAADPGARLKGWEQSAIPAMPACLLGIGSVLVAIQFGFARFAVYAGALVVAGVVVALLQVNPGWALFAGGVLTATAGLILLLHFLRAFPALPSDLG